MDSVSGGVSTYYKKSRSLPSGFFGFKFESINLI